MAHWDNLATREVQAQMDARWWEGLVAGAEADPMERPDFLSKPATLWGPYQRGFFVGWELREKKVLE